MTSADDHHGLAACYYQAWFDNTRKLHQLATDLETLSLRAFEQAEGSSKR